MPETPSAPTVPRTQPDLHAAIADVLLGLDADSHAQPPAAAELFVLLAQTYIGAVGYAGVMLRAANGTLRCSTPGSGVGHLIDKLQEDAAEGPCLDAAAHRDTVRIDDFAQDVRWPNFTAAVLSQTPVRSLLCVPLCTLVDTVGVLSLYAGTPRALGADAEHAARILASHAALALHAVQNRRQMRAALGSRDIIGQAKGILMERYGIDGATAFTLLTRLAEQSQKPVVVIAKELVDPAQKARHSAAPR